MRYTARRTIFLFLVPAALSGLLTGCSSLFPGEQERRVTANIYEGDRQLNLGNEAQARFWYDQAVKIAPNSAATYLGASGLDGSDMTGGLIWSLSQHNDWPDMERYLTQATKNPRLSNQWLIWESLAQAQQSMGETSVAQASYQGQLSAMTGGKSGAMIAFKPEAFTLAHANAEWGVGQQAVARAELMGLISRHPDIAPDAENELAYSEAVSNVNIPEAVKLAAKAVSDARENGFPDEVLGEYLDTLGWAEYRGKQYGPALSDLQEGIGYIPREPVSHYHLAEVYAALHESQAAQIEIERASYLSPSDSDTKVALQQIMPGTAQPNAQLSAAKPAA